MYLPVKQIGNPDSSISQPLFFWCTLLKVHGEECAAECPAGSRGRAAERGQGEPHGAVGFLALGWNWSHWLSENVTRCATRTSVFACTTLRGDTPNIFSSVLCKCREWPRRTVGGFKPPKPPVAWPLRLAGIVYRACQKTKLKNSHKNSSLQYQLWYWVRTG